MSSAAQTSAPRAGSAEFGAEPLRRLLRVYLLFLRAVFKVAPGGVYQWIENDPTASKLAITGDIPVAASAIGAKPHIACYFAGAQWEGVGLDQLRSENLLTGSREHQDFIASLLTASILSNSGQEATNIGFHVANMTWALRRVLMKCGFHDIGQRPSMSAPTPPGALVQGDHDGGIVAVHVTFPYKFAWAISVTELGNQVFEELEFTISTEEWTPITQPSVPAGIIGSAQVTTSGEKPVLGINPLAGLPASMRDQYVVTGTMDDPTPSESISRTMKIKEN